MKRTIFDIRRRPVIAALIWVLAGSACNRSSEDRTNFNRFLKSVYREPGTGLFIVDGDTPIQNLDELRQFYFKYIASGPATSSHSGIDHQQQGLAVMNIDGVDVVWDRWQKRSISYCVSTAFGSHYNAVVQAMQDATRGAWERTADVRFEYRQPEDSHCNATNNNVVFDVSPTSGQPYLARAFFPNNPRSARNILIDSSAFGQVRWSLAGILRHEVGHTLGFRHEHTRPEAGICFEDNDWRPLTSYDSNSVMHYPQCHGTNEGDLVLTERDRSGAASLYGLAPRLVTTVTSLLR